MSDADIGLSPNPDVEYLSRSELLAELADADERLERLHEVPTENRDRLVETWLVQDRRRILAELNRRHIANEAFPLPPRYVSEKPESRKAIGIFP